MNTIIFENKDHENRYNEYIEKMPRKDGFNNAYAYLLALSGHNPNDIYDFENHKIIPDGMGACWQTSTLRELLLFCSHCGVITMMKTIVVLYIIFSVLTIGTSIILKH